MDITSTHNSDVKTQNHIPNLYIVKLAATGLLLPYPQCMDCDHGFSALSRVKTDICNHLSSKILNHLTVITVEGLSPEEYPDFSSTPSENLSRLVVVVCVWGESRN